MPGPYDPITDLYDVQASDAHALGAGVVPVLRLAELRPHGGGPARQPEPCPRALHDVAAIVGKSAVGTGRSPPRRAVRRRLRNPRLAAQATDLGRTGRTQARAARRESPLAPSAGGETLTEFASRLDCARGDPSGTLTAVAKVAEDAAYGRRRAAARGARPARCHAQGIASLAHGTQAAGRTHPAARWQANLSQAPRSILQGSTPTGSSPRQQRETLIERRPFDDATGGSPSAGEAGRNLLRRRAFPIARRGRRTGPLRRSRPRPRRCHRAGDRPTPGSSRRTGRTICKGRGRRALQSLARREGCAPAAAPCSAALVQCSARTVVAS